MDFKNFLRPARRPTCHVKPTTGFFQTVFVFIDYQAVCALSCLHLRLKFACEQEFPGVSEAGHILTVLD